MSEPRSIKEFNNQSWEDKSSNYTLSQYRRIGQGLVAKGIITNKEFTNVGNARVKSGKYKVEPSAIGKSSVAKGIKAILNSDIAKAIAGKGKKTATSSMEAAQGQAEDAKKKNKGGSITKNRIGGNDYRKGGYVLSTMDNRKVKRNGK